MTTYRYVDDQYPFTGFAYKRLIARAFVFDDQGRVAIHRIHRNDRFCHQVYFETPGGGVDEGETVEEAVKRECKEEIGCSIEVVEELGVVFDAYNLIRQESEAHFFLCRKVKDGATHFVSEGDSLIEETLWVPLEEAIRLYEETPDEKVSLLVKRRELPFLRALARR